MTDRTFDANHFSRRPADDDMQQKIAVVRCPPKGLSGITVLSHDVLGAYVHYWRGRSAPCQGENCDACDGNAGRRWRGYVMGISGKTGRIGAIEITAAAMASFDEYFRKRRTLRGATLAMQRKGEKPNGELIALLKSPMGNVDHLPKAPDLQAFLARLWDIVLVKRQPIVTDRMLRIQKAREIAESNGLPE